MYNTFLEFSVTEFTQEVNAIYKFEVDKEYSRQKYDMNRNILMQVNSELRRYFMLEISFIYKKIKKFKSWLILLD